jgi:hypothetical protein
MLAMYQDEIVPGLRKQVEELEAKIATDNNVGSKWISVKDRLPELGQRVLCCGSKGGLFVTRTRECAGRLLIVDAERKVQRKATHWMPLPEPPKEKAKQDCTYNRNGHCIGQKLMPECDAKNCDRRK